MKTCTNCQQTKSETDFHKGSGNRCKACKNAAGREWRRKNPDKVREANREWYRENRERALAYVAAYQKTERGKAVNHAANKRYRKTDKGEAQQRASRQRNREIQRRCARLWRKTASGRALNARKNALRRSRVKGMRNDFTAEQWETLKIAYGERCAYCGQVTELTQDHVIPLAQGGEHTALNIVPACQPCNSRKGNRTPEQWEREQNV
jgi:5-methylcytosine-specific restriction endonuclease McrA